MSHTIEDILVESTGELYKLDAVFVARKCRLHHTMKLILKHVLV